MEMNAQVTKIQAAENDLKQLMAEVTWTIEKAQQAVARISSKAAVATTEPESTSHEAAAGAPRRVGVCRSEHPAQSAHLVRGIQQTTHAALLQGRAAPGLALELTAAGVGNCRAIAMERASQFAQSGAFQSIGSMGSSASTIFVHQLTSHRTVGVSS